MALIGKPINGISLNGKEYVLGSEGKPIEFQGEEPALSFLAAHGIGERDIAETGIVFGKTGECPAMEVIGNEA